METTTKVEDVHAQFETLERKIAYLDGVRDYAKFVNDSVGITLTRVDHEV